MPGPRFAYWISCACLIGLILLCVSWELVLAPMRPGGSWMVLKVVPLLFALRGVLHARRYTLQWTCLLACIYLMEGLTRSYTDKPPSNWLAMLETAMSVGFLVGAMVYTRATRAPAASQ